jgi:hypothetical protein
MPSFFILDWSVVRFMPRRATAPVRPLDHAIGVPHGAQDMLTLGDFQGNRPNGGGRCLCFQLPERNPHVGSLG